MSQGSDGYRHHQPLQAPYTPTGGGRQCQPGGPPHTPTMVPGGGRGHKLSGHSPVIESPMPMLSPMQVQGGMIPGKPQYQKHLPLDQQQQQPVKPKKKTRRAPKRNKGNGNGNSEKNRTPYSELPWEDRKKQLEADANEAAGPAAPQSGRPGKRKRGADATGFQDAEQPPQQPSSHAVLTQHGSVGHAAMPGNGPYDRQQRPQQQYQQQPQGLGQQGHQGGGGQHHHKHHKQHGQPAKSGQPHKAQKRQPMREQPPPAPRNTTQIILEQRSNSVWGPPELTSSQPASPGAEEKTGGRHPSYDTDSDFNSAFDDAMVTTYESWNREDLIGKIRELDEVIEGMAELAAQQSAGDAGGGEAAAGASSSKSAEDAAALAGLRTKVHDLTARVTQSDKQMGTLLDQVAELKEKLDNSRNENARLQTDLDLARQAADAQTVRAAQMSRTVQDLEAEEASEFGDAL